MAYSIQRAVSDGTLSTIPLDIEFFEQSHISVFVNDLVLPDGTYTYSWIGPTTIQITPAVANGLEVLIKRSTPYNEAFHNFKLGAVFKDTTVDENFLQILYLTQENIEGQTTTDFYSDLNFHGYKLRNIGTALLATDAVSLGQYQADANGAYQQRILAQTAAAGAATSEANALASKNSAQASATSASASASTATTQASAASASAASAASSASSASSSATTATTKASEAGSSASAAASSAAAALTSQNAAAGSASSASTSATNAGNSATSASTSATNAANSATSASTSASTATTKASEASTSAANAATSASSASTSATSASASATAAANSYDAFDDRYLGAKASDPTLDNDGNTLLTGALYWNTSTNKMRVFSGTSWGDVGSSISGTRFEYKYIATAGQTTFSGPDVASVTLAYDVGFINVCYNGVKLDRTDYTATNGTSVILNTGATLNAEITIEAFGAFTLANTYTKAETDGLVQGAMPIGAMLPFAGAASPSGYFLCDGSAKSRTTYAALFAVIGTTYGVGDGSTTFNVPDTRGVVLRGLDGGRGLDTGRSLGTYQGDVIASHTVTVTDPGHIHNMQRYDFTSGVSGSNGGTGFATLPATKSATVAWYDMATSGAGAVTAKPSTTGITASYTGGTETRMKNLAINHIIKY